MKPTRVALVCSAGGHLAQLVALRPWWSQYDRFWVTFDKPDSRELLSGERVYWASGPTNRDLGNFMLNLRLALQVWPRERPDLLVSNGAGVGVPFFMVATWHGAHRVWIEVPNRLDGPSLTGRLVAPLADVVVVAQPAQRAFYPGATVLQGMP